jgi:hypothetical protein
MNTVSAQKMAENDKQGLLDVSLDEKAPAKVSFSGDGRLTVGSIMRAQSPGTLSNLSVDDDGQLRVGRAIYQSLPDQRQASKPPGPPQNVSLLKAFWVRNKGLALVLMAQIFNCLMNVTTRLLEVEGNGGKGFHPLQVYPTDYLNIE